MGIDVSAVRAAGRTGQNRQRGVGGGLLQIDQTAGVLHDRGFGECGLAAAISQAAQVAGQQGGEGGVDLGGGGALVLPERPDRLMR